MVPRRIFVSLLAVALGSVEGLAQAQEPPSVSFLAVADGGSSSFLESATGAERRGGPRSGGLDHEGMGFPDPWQWEREHEWEYHAPASSVPEPGSPALLLAGLGLVAFAVRRRSRRRVRRVEPVTARVQQPVTLPS